MSIRRPSFLIRAASVLSALSGLLGGVIGGRGGTVAANAANRDPGPKPTTRGPRPARKSYIRGRGPQWVGRAVVTGKERCDARNHYRGKVYSDLDQYFLTLAQDKRERKQAKRVTDVTAQERSMTFYGIPDMRWTARQTA